MPDEQVEPAVSIEVEEGTRDTPSGMTRAALSRTVSERSLAVVVQQAVPLEKRDVEVDAPVVVIVPCGDTHAVPGKGDTAGLRDVRESQGARAVRVNLEVVSKEPAAPVRVSTGRSGLAQILALDKKHIQISIAVTVEQRDARSNDLGIVELARTTAEVREHKSGFFGRIDEPRGLGVDGSPSARRNAYDAEDESRHR